MNHFDNTLFQADLLQELIRNVLLGKFEKFKIYFLRSPQYSCPYKGKHVKCNQSPLMSKQPRKAIMTRNRLLNKYRKDNSAGNLFAYKRQRNF